MNGQRERLASPIPVVVLAAGASSRLGEAKQLVPFQGRTLLTHAITTAIAADCGPVLAVLGAGGDSLRNEAIEAGARVVENPDWATGLGSSIRVAIDWIEAEIPEAGAVLCLVCDQPLMTAGLLATIIQAHRDGHDLVAATYDGAMGVPALFSRRFFGELRGLPGDVGARRILARHSAQVHAVPFPGGSIDVDIPADLARLAAEGQTPRGS